MSQISSHIFSMGDRGLAIVSVREIVEHIAEHAEWCRQYSVVETAVMSCSPLYKHQWWVQAVSINCMKVQSAFITEHDEAPFDS